MAIVTVLGDALLDVHAVPSSPPSAGADVPAAIHIGPGGQGANLAVRLARRGHRVRLVTAIGTDAIGALLREWLAAEGVDVRAMRVDASGAVVVLGEARGERTMLSQRVPIGAASLDAGLDDAAWLVVSGYAVLETEVAELGGGIPSNVRRSVVGCALPPARVTAWSRAVAELRPDLVVLNADEARQLSHGSGTATDVRAELGGIVIVTGPGRADAATQHDRVLVEYPARAAIDTTGAGDAFAATLVSELAAEPWPPSLERLDEAMRAAGRVATAVTQEPGAQAPVPGEATSGAAPR